MPELPQIWSDAFLDDEIREIDAYKEIDDEAVEAFAATARELLAGLQGVRADEQLTIERAITPLLEALGWPTPLPKRNLTSRDEVDLVLYPDVGQRELSLGVPERDQVLRATGIVECKAWDSPFDASGSGSRPGETAAQQLQRYLLTAGTDSNEALRWGVLTNGARWRIYSYRARPRDRTWEIDLADLLVSQDLFNQVLTDQTRHQLRIAWLLFRRDSWIAAEGEREALLDRLLNEGRRRDAKVADDLSDVIFNHVYPDLVRLFWGKQPDAEPDIVARAALTFLYRLLFIYYAEDRGMLDTENLGYRPHSLRHSVRDPIAELGEAATHSTVSTQYWQRLKTLRAMIDQGDESIGQPAYNGGLFAADHPVLNEIELSDAELAPIIRQLSHTADGTYISYRSLEVQQLGSIYERLLERVPQRSGNGGDVEVVISPYARKDSGSYYTPQELVDLIVKQTLTPLVEERIAAFRNQPTEFNDPAAAILKLKILDPAMGSGHFLITAVDWLTTRLAALVNREWDEAEPGYVSPIRAELRQLQEDHPDLRDETLLQRMVLKRCIYGVDKNPLAVELAKVAFWLHTFTPPLPLPYLEHRFRAGDALLGIGASSAATYVAEWGPDRIAAGLLIELPELAGNIESNIDAMAASLDLDIDQVRESVRRHGLIRQFQVRLRTALNLVAGLRWLSAGMTKTARKVFHEPLREALRGDPARADAILHNGENHPGLTPATPEFHEIRDRARRIADREHFFHWDVEFSDVMELDGDGFDAIISNPPWDRIEQQEREWFAARGSEIANLEPAARRKAAIAEGIANGDPLCNQYEEVRAQAAAMRLVCRTSGEYPLLSSGRTNFYSLFVERALTLLRADGIAGLLTPSGIYSDKTASRFFRAMSRAGQIGGIYDFENRRTANPDATTKRWFPDVHPQFKFCATILGGPARWFDQTYCGFYLNGKSDLADSERVFPLTPDDFAQINPNTGTAPLLRSRTEARLVQRIYREHPVLVDRAAGELRRPYGIRFHAMFDMTGDSRHFRTAEQLEAEGCYRVAGHRWRRGDAEWAPLYQGRMIHHFDHRANAVGFNPDNQDNPYFSIEVSDEEKQDAAFFPNVQYWVSVEEIVPLLPRSQRWVIAFRDIARSTDERTMIATIAPWAAFGNQTPLLLPDPELEADDAALLTANLSSLAFDFVAKRKVQGTHLNWYIVEQLPVIAPADYDREFGGKTARELVREHVLQLSYTAHDLAPFALELGYEGEPFTWDPEERRQLRARLDALYFHLYGLDEDAAAYILDQFPVLEKNERRAHGRFLSKELVLGHYRALAAGDTTSDVMVLD